MDLLESRFAEFFILFISGYIVSIYQRLDLLYIGCCLTSELDSLVGETL